VVDKHTNHKANKHDAERFIDPPQEMYGELLPQKFNSEEAVHQLAKRAAN
jgi:hypothetical protein